MLILHESNCGELSQADGQRTATRMPWAKTLICPRRQLLVRCALTRLGFYSEGKKSATAKPAKQNLLRSTLFY